MERDFLRGKNAIVTGGARGIGKEVAMRLAKQGCRLAILDIENEVGQETARELSEFTDAVFYYCDVSVVEKIKEVFCQVVERFGQVDILINNAGIAIRDYISDITEAKWNRFNDINVKSVFFLSQIFAEQVREKGLSYSRIVNMSSIRTILTDDYHAGYCITKTAVNKITQTFAVSYGKYGLTSNAVALGFVTTPMTEHYFKDDPNFAETLRKHSPLGRAITTTEVAATVEFLLSQGAAAVNGQIIAIDGGGTCSEGNYA